MLEDNVYGVSIMRVNIEGEIKKASGWCNIFIGLKSILKWDISELRKIIIS